MNNPYIARVLDFNVNNKIDYSVKKRPAPSLAIELKPNLDASGITIVADENGEPIALDDGYGRPIPLDDSPIQSSKKRKSTKMPSKKEKTPTQPSENKPVVKAQHISWTAESTEALLEVRFSDLAKASSTPAKLPSRKMNSGHDLHLG